MTEETNKIEGTGRKLPHPRVPREVARAFLVNECAAGEDLTLRHWRGDFMTWTGTHWRKVSRVEVRACVKAFTDGAFYHDADGKPVSWVINKTITDNIMDELVSLILLPDATEPGTWLSENGFGPCIAFENCLLDLATREEFDCDPRYFNLACMPFSYNPSATGPEFERFMASCHPGHDGKTGIRTCAQMLGYLISGRTDLQKMFSITGPSGSGKSTFGWVMSQLVGRDATQGLTVALLGERFGLAGLDGKRLGILDDVRTLGPKEQKALERLLSITGEGLLPVENKGVDVHSAVLPVVPVIISNDTPHVGDSALAVNRRFVYVKFGVDFTAAPDNALKQKLAAELPAIFNFALAGYDDLAANGNVFVESVAAMAERKEAIDLAQPVGAFVREHCILHPDAWVAKETLRHKYNEWHERQFESKGLGEALFTKRLKDATKGRVQPRKKQQGGLREQGFEGIRLASGTAADEAARLSLKVQRGGAAG